MSRLLFVYGTLKRGGRWHRLFLNRAKFLGLDVILDFGIYQKQFLGRARPVAVVEKGKFIKGEVYRVSNLTYLAIKIMEAMAKYRAIKIATAFGKAIMFIYTRNQLK